MPQLDQERAYKAGTVVVARDGELKGALTGGIYHCRLEGCTGRRLGVRWPDRRVTFPCTEGMEWTGRRWKIR